jgi:glucose/arabinose dehydrogenase
MLLRLAVSTAAIALAACTGHALDNDTQPTDATDTTAPMDTPTVDSPVRDTPPPPDVPPPDAPPGTWCRLGGTVAGGIVPSGFCIRRFVGADDHQPLHSPVMEPRTMSFAPNGDLFVGAPMSAGAGGGSGGPGAILVLSDDNHDGIAEVHHFLDGVADVHGIAVGPSSIYFTRNDSVWSTPYAVGQRAAQTSGGTPVMTRVGDIPTPGRTTHGLALSHGGTLYVTNAAGSTTGTCPDPGSGYIRQIHSDGTGTNVAIGFRNPMYIRCHFADETCFATELGEDGGASYGAREKLLSIRPSTNYGYPCCATTNMPAPGYMSCGTVTMEEVQFTLNDTPFGMDWERGLWPAPYQSVMCVAKHGSFYSSPSWVGTGVFCAPTNPTTHSPSAPFQIFVDGFGSGHISAGQLYRAADLAFAPDGRMFVSDDIANEIYYIAPLSLPGP